MCILQHILIHSTCTLIWLVAAILNSMLLLLLSRFSHVWLFVIPQMAAHQAPLSLGFSRQEHWSGLPFPSPMHEREKWKWSRSVVSDSSRPHGLQPTRLTSMGFSRQEYWSGVPLPSPTEQYNPTVYITHLSGSFFGELQSIVLKNIRNTELLQRSQYLNSK